MHRAGSSHANADDLLHRPCAAEGCRHCENKETREKELGQENEAAQPVCEALRVVDTPEWRLRQEQDDNLRPVLRWLEAQQRPEWGDIAWCSHGGHKRTVVQIQHCGSAKECSSGHGKSLPWGRTDGKW